MTTQSTIDRMARVMRAHQAAHGACTYHDLTEAGFTPAEIDRAKHEARALAARLRNADEPGSVLGLPDPAAVRRRIARAVGCAMRRDVCWSPGFLAPAGGS